MLVVRVFSTKWGNYDDVERTSRKELILFSLHDISIIYHLVQEWKALKLEIINRRIGGTIALTVSMSSKLGFWSCQLDLLNLNALDSQGKVQELFPFQLKKAFQVGFLAKSLISSWYIKYKVANHSW